MSSMSSIWACCEIKGHSIWGGFCENGIMTQRKRGRKVEDKKKETEETGSSFTAGCVSLALFHALHPWLSPCHHCNPTTTTVEVSHKDPFCPRHHHSHIFSALILHERLHRENTNKGKTYWAIQRAGGWWGPRRRNQLSQTRESGHVTPGAIEFVCELARMIQRVWQTEWSPSVFTQPWVASSQIERYLLRTESWLNDTLWCSFLDGENKEITPKSSPHLKKIYVTVI